MAMHKRNAVAGMEGYARHAAAVEEIKAKGASSLREALASDTPALEPHESARHMP